MTGLIFLAVEAGADYIECDLQFTKDQGIVYYKQIWQLLALHKCPTTMKIG